MNCKTIANETIKHSLTGSLRKLRHAVWADWGESGPDLGDPSGEQAEEEGRFKEGKFFVPYVQGRGIVGWIVLWFLLAIGISWLPLHHCNLQGWITRVILKMVDGPHYAEFAIRHPLIHDPKLRQFEATQLKEERTGWWTNEWLALSNRDCSHHASGSPRLTTCICDRSG